MTEYSITDSYSRKSSLLNGSSFPESVESLNNHFIEQLGNILNAHQQLRRQMDWLKNIEGQLSQSQQDRGHHNYYQQKYSKLLRENNTQQKQKYELGKQNEKYKRETLFLQNQIAALKDACQKNIKTGEVQPMLQNSNLENKSRKIIKNLLEEEVIKLSQQIYNNELENERKIVQKDKELLFLRQSLRKNFQIQVDKIKKQNDALLVENRQLKYKLNQGFSTAIATKANSLQQKEKIVRQKLKELKQQKIQQLINDICGLRIKMSNKKKDQKRRETQEEIRILELKIQNECLKISEKCLLNKINCFEWEIKQLQKLEGENIQINKQLINRLRNPSKEDQQDQKNKKANLIHKQDQAILQQKLQQKLEAVKRQWSLKEIKWIQTYGVLKNNYEALINKQKEKAKVIEQLGEENWKLKMAINDMKQSKKKQKEKQQKILMEIQYETFASSEEEIIHLKDRLKIAQNELIDQKALINALKSESHRMEQKINSLEKTEKQEKRKFQQLYKQNNRLKLELDDIKVQIIRIRKYYAYTKQQYEELLSRFQQVSALNTETEKKRNDKNKQKQISFNLNNANEPNGQQRKQKITKTVSVEDQGQGLSVIYETSQLQQRLNSKQSEQVTNEKIQYISVSTHQQDFQKPTLHTPARPPLSPSQNHFHNVYLPSDSNQRNNSQKSYSHPNTYSAISLPSEQPYFVSSALYQSNETKKTYLLHPSMNNPSMNGASINSPLKEGRYFGNQSPQSFKIINNNGQRFSYSPQTSNINTGVNSYPTKVNNGESKSRYVVNNPVIRNGSNGYFAPYKI